MFWNSARAALPVSLPARLARWVAYFTLLATTAVLGLSFYPYDSLYGPAFWSGWTGMAAGILLHGAAHKLWARWRFQKSVRCAFADCGAERHTLAAIAIAIRGRNEARAMRLLAAISNAPLNAPAGRARDWLAALAGVHWIARQSPFDTLPESREPFPQLHALMHCGANLDAPLRAKLLSTELERVSSLELDAYARAHIALVDALAAALENPAEPFASCAQELLPLISGHTHSRDAHERYAVWWRELRPLYARGGGALLAAVRLIRRAAFGDAARLLERFARDGMLSAEADTLRRAARFLAVFSAPPWRDAGADIQRYFDEGLYHQWNELGVFRCPTAELPDVVACCVRGKVCRDAKRRLIEDALELWHRAGSELAEPLAFLLKKILDESGRHHSTRMEFWVAKWELRKNNFDRDVELLMNGIVCASRENWQGALACFEAAAKLGSAGSIPLVNSVSVLLKSGRSAEAKQLIERLQVQFPKDGYALLSLGRLLAIHADDTRAAERLFLKALNLLDPPTDALNCMGEVKLLAGNYDESQHWFEQARQLSPEQPGPKLGLARVHLEQKRFNDAVTVLKEVARDGPGDARDIAYFMLYRTHREAGQDRASLKYLELLPARFFNDPDTIDDIAVHLESEKMYAKAREFTERAMLLRVYGKGRNGGSDALRA